MYETKTELLENFKKIPLDQQNKIIHIREWTQKCPKDFRPKTYLKLDRDCFVCDTLKELQPHHMTYVPIEETLTLCNKCHSFVHERHIRYRSTPEEIEASLRFRERLRNPTIEDMERNFSFTNRCKLGKCSACQRNCFMRRQKAKAIKFRIEQNKWRWTNAN